MISRFRGAGIAAGIVLFALLGWWFFIRPKPVPAGATSSGQTARKAPVKSASGKEAVAALGQLEPLGDIRRLAAPRAGMAGTPRVEVLQVAEGQRLRSSGQRLRS